MGNQSAGVGSNQRILTKEDAYLFAWTNSTAGPHVALYNSTGTLYRANISISLPAAGTWTHLAATFDGSTLVIYQNGLLINSTSTTGNVRITATPLQIGSFGTGEIFNGTLDEISIWNRTLTGAEINGTRLNGTRSVSTAGLVANWAFDNGLVVCPADFSQLIVTTDCGGVADKFDSTPFCV